MTRRADAAWRRLRAGAFALAIACPALAHAQAADLPVLKAGTSGDSVCTRCHGAEEKKPILSIHRTRHGVAAQPGCQACHGSSRPHVLHKDEDGSRPAPDFVFNGPNRSSAEIQSRTCLNCHKPGKRLHWQGSVHPSNDVTCASCHTIHLPADPVLARETQREVCYRCHKAQRAQAQSLSTHGESAGKVACGDCHNPHGTTSPKLLVKNTLNETCFSCHADKRGPFLWEHPPSSDDCSHCHNPHGSNIAPLLKLRPPWLCQACHAGSLHTTPALSGRNLAPGSGAGSPGSPGGGGPGGAGGNTPSQQLLLRACLNCHSAIHGSNHPSGARFTR